MWKRQGMATRNEQVGEQGDEEQGMAAGGGSVVPALAGGVEMPGRARFSSCFTGANWD